MPCRFPGPHPRGKFRGICQGGLQAHTQGGSLGGSGPGPQPKGQGGCSRGVVETPPVTATAAGGTHPT